MMNPHGMHKMGNLSSASDMVRITAECMKSQLFREIVRKKSYVGQAWVGGSLKSYDWQNTNKILDPDFCIGAKTGHTSSAGSCLSAVFSVDGLELAVVYMGGEKTREFDSRFEDVPKLAIWAYETLNTLLEK